MSAYWKGYLCGMLWAIGAFFWGKALAIRQCTKDLDKLSKELKRLIKEPNP